MGDRARFTPWRWRGECTVMTRDDGAALHMHSRFGQVRQVLFVTPHGAEYRMPDDVDRITELVGLPWEQIVLALSPHHQTKET